MRDTYHSPSDLPRVIGDRPTKKWRGAGLALTVLLGSILVIWVSRTTWLRVNSLQHEFAGLKADRFYLGGRMRGDIQQLNDALLRYRLRGDPGDAEIFRNGTQQFRHWLDRHRTNALTALERDFFQRTTSVYDEYEAESMKVLEANRAGWESTRARNFQDSYEKVQNQSRYLLGLCDKFMDDQRTAFDQFLLESTQTLKDFERLLQLSLALVLVLVLALVGLVYRGMIAPLRHRLTESAAIIARQEKLASLGVLAAGVAHEIRNPLTAIKFRLFSLKKTLLAPGVENEDAEVIGKEINRLERIVKDFLQFARPSEPELVTVPVHRLLQEVCDLLGPQLQKSAIRLELEHSQPCWVRADTQQLKQVLINLIQNSAESIERKGSIRMRTRLKPGPGRKGSPLSVTIEVEDTGKGIEPDVRERLFDPFFTTKESGSGLGLPIAARIIEKHRGELHYQTELHRGTVFIITLPGINENESTDPVD
jgi:signal transduction histidine kinase